MSVEHLEIVRRAYESFNQSGFSSGETLQFFDESVVFEEPPEQPGPRVARGKEEAARIFGQFDEAWETHASDPQEFIVIDDDRVLALTIEHFRGRDGIELIQPSAAIYTFHEGKIVRMQAFWEQANARKAAGLEE